MPVIHNYWYPLSVTWEKGEGQGSLRLLVHSGGHLTFCPLVPHATEAGALGYPGYGTQSQVQVFYGKHFHNTGVCITIHPVWTATPYLPRVG